MTPLVKPAMPVFNAVMTEVMNASMNADGVSEPHGKIPLDEPTMLKPEDVARRWGVNVKTVYSALRRRQIPHKRLGQRVLLIPRRAVEAIEQGRGVLPGGK